MKIRTTAAIVMAAAGLAALAPLAAQAQQGPTVKAGAASAPGAAMAARTVKATGTITAIDAATRVVTLKGDGGKVVSITAGPEVKRFAELKVGDKVTLEYLQALSLELKKGGAGATGAAEKQSAARAAPGQAPGGAVARQVTILADVVEVNAGKKTVTLRGPGGNLVDLSVQDPNQLKNIKKGDQVEAVYTEALAVAVEPAK
jgi:Cu/Ag efflux protein CusF